MASRSLPPGHPSNVTRSPVRQNVTLRWLNNAAPAPATSKTARSPVKRWPPPKVEASPHVPTISAPSSPAASEPVVEKKNTAVSAFQSARAMFEAKKSSAAAVTPPPPPTRRRLTFPVPPAPAIVKQHSASSDLSSSSCSTVDAESDRKLEENVRAEDETKPWLPARVMKKVEKESVVAIPSKLGAAKVLPCPSEPAAYSPARKSQAPRPRDLPVIVITLEQEKLEGQMQAEIDPFRLLLPVEAVPTLPNEVICVYDSAAIKMEKNIKKVVRKLLKKNKVRLDEFKVNSRLFGTDFMDAHAYLDMLIKDFGPIRALQLVPCLLSIQPNMVKSNALLLTAKNYLLQNEEALEREFQNFHVSNPKDIKTAANTTYGSPVTQTIGSVAVSASLAESSGKTPSMVTLKAAPTIKTAVAPTDDAAQIASNDPAPSIVDVAASKRSSPFVQPRVPGVLPAPVTVLVQKQLTNISTEEVVMTTSKEIKPVEPMPEPQEAAQTGAPPPLINIAVSATSPTAVTARTAHVISRNPVVKKCAESDTPSDSEEEFRVDNLFEETINPPQKQQQKQQKQQNNLVMSVAPPSPTSSTHSFDEAESLFGERLSVSSLSSVGRRKTVTWGETQTVVAPAEQAAPLKTMKKPVPLIFGPATAAAFDSDSDSDEADFSD